MNLRPSGYEPDELPGCSTPRWCRVVGEEAMGGEGFPDRRARRRPTLPRVGSQYHRRTRVSRPSSEWGRVGHLGCDHRAVRSGVARMSAAGGGLFLAGLSGRTGCMVGARSWRGASSVERLGSVSSTPCGASTADLSTWWSSTALLARPGFEGGFPLRCFQRLSCPDLATQLCRWHDNWSTRGPSTPVLSY